jgi:hypothetical protein
MRAAARLLSAFAAVVAIACSDAPTDPEGPAKLPSWTLVPVDSPYVNIFAIGITPAGEVIGQFVLGGTKVGIFRWKDGVFRVGRMDGVDLLAKAINDSGDVVGITGEFIPFGAGGQWVVGKRPFIWRAGEASPTRLMSTDTALTPIDINNHRDVLLTSAEFYPGAGVLRGSELRAINPPVPISPLRLTDADVIIGQVRGSMKEEWVRVASPFRQGDVARTSGKCPWGHATTAGYIDRRGTVFSTVMRDGKIVYQVIDDGISCRSAELFPGVMIYAMNEAGWAWGFTTGSSSKYVLGRDGTFIPVRWFIGLPRADTDWEYHSILGISADGKVLMTATKVQGFGLSKPGNVMAVPK